MADEDVKARVLEVNEAFYRAFTRGDVAAMSALWSEREELLCFHPGAYLLRGREEVLAAWHQILVAPAPLEMRCHDALVQLHGNVAVVTCYEGNGEHAPHLAATNVFVLEAGDWKMLHHHAGPLVQPRIPAGRGPRSDMN
jgi:ketosteroid isomerase-like protein